LAEKNLSRNSGKKICSPRGMPKHWDLKERTMQFALDVAAFC